MKGEAAPWQLPAEANPKMAEGLEERAKNQLSKLRGRFFVSEVAQARQLHYLGRALAL
jgi:hypothetical protein